MNENELKKVLTAHTRWLDGKEGGTRAEGVGRAYQEHSSVRNLWGTDPHAMH